MDRPELRRGSTFEIYLPRTEARPIVTEPAQERVPPGGGERVLDLRTNPFAFTEGDQ